MFIFALFISLLWVTTGLKSYVVLGLGLFVGRRLYRGHASSTQVQGRVTEWLDPWSAAHLSHVAPAGLGWFSIAAGGVTGTGLGLGQSGNIPFITSDMIFAAVAEELGLPRRHPGAVPLRRVRRRGLSHRPARDLGLRAPHRDRASPP